MGTYFLGLDWGTSNSSLAYVFDEGGGADRTPEVQTVKFVQPNGAEDARLPSLVVGSLPGQASSFATGWEALGQIWAFATQRRRSAAKLLRHGANLFRSVKSDMGASRVYPFSCGSQIRTPEDAAALIFKDMIEAAGRARPMMKAGEASVVVSVPASLSAAARRETLAAAAQAGLSPERMELIDEPIAALLHALSHRETAAHLCGNRPRRILVYDYGGGTLDLCLVECRREPGVPFGFEVRHLAISQYLRNGGNDVDAAIMDAVLWPQVEHALGVRRADLPLPVHRAVADTLTALVARQLKEQMCAWISAERGGAAKAAPSSGIGDHEERMVLPLRFEDDGLPHPLRVDFGMTRSAFEKVMEDFVAVPYGDENAWPRRFGRSVFLPIFDTVRKAGLTVEQVDVVLYHGGSCRNPLVRAALEDAFARKDWLFSRAALVPSPSLNTSVAEGAALACWWRRVKGVDPVKPIVAESVGIMDRKGVRHMLVPASEPMPYPSEDGWSTVEGTFCVPENDAPVMIVPWFTGRDRPHWIRLDLKGLSELRKNDAVTIEFRIDRDKVLHWRYRIKGGAPRDAESIEDIWLTRDPNPEQKRLMEHRRGMKAWAEKHPGLRFPKDMVFNEANLCRLAGDFETAELLSLEFMRAFGDDADLLNILGIMANNRGRSAQAVQYSERAMQLAPANAVFVGNLGFHMADDGRHADAEQMLRRALAMRPDLVYVHERLGRLLESLGRRDEAQASFRAAVELLQVQADRPAPERDTFAQLARLFRHLGDQGRAEELSRRHTLATEQELKGGEGRFVIASYRSEAQ